MAFLRAAKNEERVVIGYERLTKLLLSFADINILGYDTKAAVIYKDLKKQKPRVGTMDLRIAAICLSHEATLITRNLRDFHRIPGLKCDDWTK